MENSLEKLISQFKGQYSSIVREPEHKFSTLPKDRMEMEARLMASYELNIERRGGHVIWDKETKEIIDKVVDWMYDEHRWLILYGPFGTGKTSMLKTLRTIFPASTYCTAINFFEEFKVNEKLPAIEDKKILLLDDLGAESPICKIFGEDRTPITDLLLRRYDRFATTVIATNMTLEEIQKRYGDRLADRIVEMAIAILYDMPSYRGR